MNFLSYADTSKKQFVEIHVKCYIYLDLHHILTGLA